MDLVKLREKLMPAVAAFIPLLELYFARSLYRKRVDLYIDSGFMIGLGITFFALFLIYREAGKLRLQKNLLLVNILCLALSFMRYTKIPLHPEWIGFLWVVIVGTGLCLFIDPMQLLRKIRDNIAFGYFIGATYIILVMDYMLNHINWVKAVVWYRFFSIHITNTVRYLLDTIGYEMLPPQRLNQIRHEDLMFYIYTPCSGMEAITFFIVVFSCMMMLDYKSIPVRKIIAGYLAGIALMMGMNILRIILFFIFGVWATRQWGREEGTQFVLDLFHNNVGWVLYATAIAAYFVLFYKYVDKEKPPQEKTG
jgi:exosortase/archaeosortase family protein